MLDPRKLASECRWTVQAGTSALPSLWIVWLPAAGGDFQEIIAREVDKLKESLLASFAEKFPARSCRPARAVCLVGLGVGGGWCRTVNAFKTAGHSDADTSSRGRHSMEDGLQSMPTCIVNFSHIFCHLIETGVDIRH